MSSDAKALGTLTFDSAEDLADVFEELRDSGGDAAMDEVRHAVKRGTRRKGKTLTVKIDAHFSNEGNLWFQEWLEDVATSATGGHLDTWQEEYGDKYFVRLQAGGAEEQVQGAFPPVPK